MDTKTRNRIDHINEHGISDDYMVSKPMYVIKTEEELNHFLKLHYAWVFETMFPKTNISRGQSII